MIDHEKLADGILAAVEGYVSKRVATLESRIAELTGRLSAMPVPKDGAAGRDGVDGKSVTVDDVRPMVEALFAAVPKAQDGAPGRDGASVDMGVVQASIDAAVARSVAALPVAKDGAPGKDGRDGVDGKPGEKGEPGERGEKGIDGAPGRDGVDGRSGADGAPGEKGVDGISGKDGAPGEHGRDGRDGLPGVPGTPGEKGIDGRDGFTLDDFDIEAKDGGRVLAFRLKSGEREVVREIRTGALVYRGVWKAGTYSQGDSATFGGSLWIAKRDTTQAPGTGDDWQLAVKRGQDAK